MDHFNSARVIIDDEIQTVEEEGVTFAFRRARVITVNGQIWQRLFCAFGLDATRVQAVWDERQLQLWEKVEAV
jgi:hypothetical protein